jgi:hypothetical protein
VSRQTLHTWNAYWALPAKTEAAANSWAGLQTAGENDPERLLPWSAITLKPHVEAVEVPGTAGLFYQRRVGRGSLLVSGISLAMRDLVNWSGFDSFLNGALLRRPRRHFTKSPYGGVCVDWQDYPNRCFDSQFTTGMRLFARNGGTDENKQPSALAPPTPSASQRTWTRSLGRAEEPLPGGPGRSGGMGSWSEFGPVSSAARSALREAAGVRVPAASFVVVCLAVYLVVLVPLNWMVFHTLGHVEWAWIAAPFIALLGTLVVVRQAQLDIGFVRAQTELGVLELAGDYPRGLLSRYTALYTSLSTTYDVQFDDPWAVATPFPACRDDPTLAGQPLVAVSLALQQRVQLQGVAISSATTRMVHSEQMVALEGPLQWRKSSQGHPQVVNRTGFDLDDCMMIRRQIGGKTPLAGCWLGRLRSGQSTTVSFRPLSDLSTSQIGGQTPYADERARAALAATPPRLNIDALLKLACSWDAAGDPWYGMRDEIRLLARIDRPLPGCQISPSASQIRGATLVVAHLAFGDLQTPQPDTNGRWDVAGK